MFNLKVFPSKVLNIASNKNKKFQTKQLLKKISTKTVALLLKTKENCSLFIDIHSGQIKVSFLSSLYVHAGVFSLTLLHFSFVRFVFKKLNRLYQVFTLEKRRTKEYAKKQELIHIFPFQHQ